MSPRTAMNNRGDRGREMPELFACLNRSVRKGKILTSDPDDGSSKEMQRGLQGAWTSPATRTPKSRGEVAPKDPGVNRMNRTIQTTITMIPAVAMNR